MALRDIKGDKYVKAELLRALAARTHGRSVKSVEYKLQNISAVLLDVGLTRLEGFAPAANYQHRLGVLVLEFLQSRPEVIDVIKEMLDTVPRLTNIPARASIETSPPFGGKRSVKRRFRPRKIADAAGRDAANHKLGRAGEEFVVAIERAELARVGRMDLAARVRWVADVDGDGAGYDVQSFTPNGDEFFIEVKTTNGAKETSFYVSINELEFSAVHADQFRLYRVFSFAAEPRFYVLSGSLRESADLEAVAFRARPRGRHSGNHASRSRSH